MIRLIGKPPPTKTDDMKRLGYSSRMDEKLRLKSLAWNAILM